VARLALDVGSKTDTTSILLERRVIETLLHGQGTCPRFVFRSILIIVHAVRLFWDLFDLVDAALFYIVDERDSTHSIGAMPRDSCMCCLQSLIWSLELGGEGVLCCTFRVAVGLEVDVSYELLAEVESGIASNCGDRLDSRPGAEKLVIPKASVANHMQNRLNSAAVNTREVVCMSMLAVPLDCSIVVDNDVVDWKKQPANSYRLFDDGQALGSWG
jgi:hypothetical protein